MQYSVPDLTYGYAALEPYLDAETMHLHHDKHHQAYVDKLNACISANPSLQDMEVVEMMKNINKLNISDADRTTLINNGGGHLNHAFFWEIMSPTKEVDEGLSQKITSTFSSIESFKDQFTQAGISRFGSGWVWLVESTGGELKIYSTANQDSPYLKGDTPLIGLDVWEHAYYLKYQNRRADYIKNWWNVLKLI